MFDRKRLLIRSAAVLLVALQQSVASYGYAQADDANETLPEIRAVLTVARQADISDQTHQQVETVFADLKADNMARLEEQVRRLAGETFAAAAPTLSEQILALTERTIADQKADNRARLGEQARRSTRVALASAAPTNETAVDEAAPESVVAIQGFGTPSAEAHVSEPST